VVKGPTPYLQAAIQATHEAILHEQDPKHVQILSGCLQQMTRVQADLMQPSQGAQSAVLQQLGAA
jgi:hypothetical protein